MRRGTVFRLRGFGFFDFVSKNGLLLLIVFLISAGIILGVFLEGKVRFLSIYTESYLSRYLKMRTGHTFFRIMLDSYMSSLFSMLIIFAAGSSMLGAVLVPAAATAKGVLLGALPAVLYSQYSVKGIAFFAVLVLPSAFLFLIVYLLSVRESFQFSVMMARLSLSGTGNCDLSGQFRNYCGRYLVLSVSAVITAVLDAVLSLSLMGRFGLS